jgi:hypothetical protein
LKNPIRKRRVEMKSLFPKSLVLALLFCLLLTSCKGGGGSLTAGGGIDGTGIMSAGVVSAFGSIVVNGEEFDTSEAEIIVNGEQGFGDEFVVAKLDIGRLVTVEGTISADGETVTAERVVYSDDVAGPVTSVSDPPVNNEREIMVLGQIVVVNVITRFKPDTFGFNNIVPNDVVAVSGYFDDTGAIRATFIEKTGGFSPGMVVEAKGPVMNLQNLGLNKTFEINNLTVNYTSIADDLPEGIPAEGQFVEVEGTIPTVDGEMTALEIELADDLDGDDVEQFEIMGFVTEIISTGDTIEFKVGNQRVHVEADMAVFVDGSVNDIVLGVKLEADTEVFSETEFTVGDQDVQTDSETVFEGVLPDEIEVDMMIEVKGVPVDIDHSVLIADKVSLEEN